MSYRDNECIMHGKHKKGIQKRNRGDISPCPPFFLLSSPSLFSSTFQLPLPQLRPLRLSSIRRRLACRHSSFCRSSLAFSTLCNDILTAIAPTVSAWKPKEYNEEGERAEEGGRRLEIGRGESGSGGRR